MKRPLLNLSSTGMLTAAVYLATLVFYVKGPDAHSRTAKQVFAILSVTALLVLFWYGYKALRTDTNDSSVRTVVIFGLILAAIAVFIFPFHSTDVFGYINRGWQQVHYGQNPYTHPLSQVPNWQNDPMLRAHWIYNPNPYGFLFTLLARVLCTIGNGNWWLTLFLFKAINFVAYCATALLIWRGANRLPRNRRVATLYLFLWNPLILLHCIANGHNDILTGLLVVLAFYFAIREYWFWIIPALAGACLLKYAPGLLIPIAFVFVVKHRGWLTAIGSVALSTALIVLVSLPYLGDFDFIWIWNIQENATLVDNSLHSFLIHIFDYTAKVIHPLAALHDPANFAIKWILRAGFLLFLLWQWLKPPPDYTVDSLIKRSLLVLFVLFCIVTSKFNAWYLAVMLPTALLIGTEYWLARLIVLISAAQTFSLTFMKQAYVVNYLLMMLLPMWIVWRQERKLIQPTKAIDGPATETT
jgi:hypothetical protein